MDKIMKSSKPQIGFDFQGFWTVHLFYTIKMTSSKQNSRAFNATPTVRDITLSVSQTSAVSNFGFSALTAEGLLKEPALKPNSRTKLQMQLLLRLEHAPVSQDSIEDDPTSWIQTKTQKKWYETRRDKKGKVEKVVKLETTLMPCLCPTAICQC